MTHIIEIKEHSEIVDMNGVHIGTVDRVEGDRIKVTRRDNSHGDGQHHYIATHMIAQVCPDKVVLSAPISSPEIFAADKENKTGNCSC